MNKKILIASIFATLMLLVPMTSAVGVSDVSLNRKIEKIEDNNTITETYDNEDCGCEVVSSQHLVRLERLLNRVESYTKILSILFKFNPEIIEKTEELTNEITALKEINNALKSDYISEDFPIICKILWDIYYQLSEIWFFLYNLTLKYPQIYPFIYPIAFVVDEILYRLELLFFYLDCPDPWSQFCS